MKKILGLLATVGALSSPALLAIVPSTVWAAGSPTCASLVGSWGNQLGSTMNIVSVNPTTGAITGTYRSPSGTTGQQFPLIGWTNTAPAQNGQDNVTLVSFTVNWGNYGTVTSWSGLCRTQDRVPIIAALWNFAQSNAQFSWSHVNTGQDVFMPTLAEK
ncbi:putative exported avidin family protein [Paraburkholderia ribeironis]|uniref:Putative exported avidin family protein n=1 Tax=Paraburkholderia ribeironis TaxID=1247936 RepID=A0A1N7SL31_9BURK|nr:avidin/streptavidin family protein [Paraburkholderia ribeironis]SIT48088.1 putative exported avidin family protein [Paraburkholderia ribeironis]